MCIICKRELVIAELRICGITNQKLRALPADRSVFLTHALYAADSCDSPDFITFPEKPVVIQGLIIRPEAVAVP